MINWLSSNTARITDFNVGSTSRTLLEAVAIELEELYYQLLIAVQEAIEEAIYRAFNFQRNPAESSTGLVRFERSSGSELTISVPRGTNVATDSAPPILFETQSDDSIPVVAGRATGGGVTTLIDSSKNWVDEGIGIGAKVKNITDSGETPPSGVIAIQTTINTNDTLLFGTLSGLASFVVNNDYYIAVFYDDDGVVTDITTAAHGGILFPVALVLNEDYIYLGSDDLFFGLVFNKGGGAAQNAAASLIVEYWNGVAWVLATDLVDGTAGVGGKPFSSAGDIIWRLPSDWIKAVYQNQNLYWARISASATLTPGSQGDYFKYKRGDSYKVVTMFKDIDVQAIQSGVVGNVAANTIIILSSNIPNVADIKNLAAFSDGEDEETSSARKARFALYIQSLARATRGALEYAARTVPQIVAAKAIDDVRPTVLKEQYGSTSVFTDITNAMRNPSDPEVKLFEDTTNENDALYIGGNELFDYLNMHLIQAGVVATDNLVWEYYSADGWQSLAVTDGTDPGGATPGPLQQSGTVSWTIPNDIVATTINNFQKLWIRLRVTAGGVTFATIPTGDYCSLPPGFGYVYLYCHDGSGELNSSLITSVENAVELYRGCGIIVEVKAPTKIQPTITVTLFIASNYDATDIATKVRQALIDYLYTKVLGEDLYIAELYRFIMDSNNKAILNVNITAPISDLIVASSAVLRPNPLNVTVTGIILS